MYETVRSEIVGTTGLILAACIALFLTWCRIPRAARPEELRRTVTIFVVGLLFQSIILPRSTRPGFTTGFPRSLDYYRGLAAFFWLSIFVGSRFGYGPRSC